MKNILQIITSPAALSKLVSFKETHLPKPESCITAIRNLQRVILGEQMVVGGRGGFHFTEAL